jgi:protein-disulfide isomerase
MRRVLLFLSIGILATACTLPQGTPFPGRESSSSSSSHSSASNNRLNGEETGERAPTTEEATATGALLTETLLPTGVLEIGNSVAPLTLLLFTEHHCSYCRQFLSEIFPRLKIEYLEKGLVKLQIAMLTLRKYPGSTDAALGFLCASMQNKGLTMHSVLFANMNKSDEAILSYAKDLGLDMKQFADCVSGSGAILALRGQDAWGKTLDVSVVPTFFLNGEKFIGLPYYPDLKGRIEEALKTLREEGVE